MNKIWGEGMKGKKKGGSEGRGGGVFKNGIGLGSEFRVGLGASPLPAQNRGLS